MSTSIKGNNIFANSLLDATIQDSGMRKRNDVTYIFIVQEIKETKKKQKKKNQIKENG